MPQGSDLSHHGRPSGEFPPDIPTIFKPFNLWYLIEEAEKLLPLA
jgi:hypothetical protein